MTGELAQSGLSPFFSQSVLKHGTTLRPTHGRAAGSHADGGRAPGGGGAGAGATVLKVLRVHCEVSILSKAVALSVWA